MNEQTIRLIVAVIGATAAAIVTVCNATRDQPKPDTSKNEPPKS